MSTMELAPAESGLRVQARPRFEGSNIRTWIGFKHLMYLVEEAVLLWFRDRGQGPQALYHAHGLGLEILDSSVQLPALVELDDEVQCLVTPRRPGQFSVTIRVPRPGSATLAVRGRVTVALVPEDRGRPPAPPALGELVAAGLQFAAAGQATASVPDGFRWTWTGRYFHCHYSDRVQHSAYVRALEEVVDRFLAARGMSIRTLLDERGWIPVVSRARVRLLAPAHMEEEIHTTFQVTEILRGTAFDAVMDCHVERDGRAIPVASAQILHGYAASRGPDAGRLVELDAGVIARLTGPRG